MPAARRTAHGRHYYSPSATGRQASAGRATPDDNAPAPVYSAPMTQYSLFHDPRAASDVAPAPSEAVPPPGYQAPEEHLDEVRDALLDWFSRHRRSLPWRGRYTPYEVWISEVMLQQTQMERGVAYFLRWMDRFPDVAALAAAREEDVLRAWEGLGYYNRARNLHRAARHIMAQGGVFPETPEAIRALPGIGPYTAAAIASIAFNVPVACVDANVERVVSRLFDVDSPVKREPAASLIRQWAATLLPPEKAREHNQAMMELGALVCGKKTRCGACPLERFCTARHLGIVHERPVPGRKSPVVPLTVASGVLVCHDRIFVQQRLNTGAWARLWEFPGGRVEPDESPADAVVREFLEETGFAVRVRRPCGVIRHGYTTFRVTLHCFILELEDENAAATRDEEGRPLPDVLTAATDCRWLSPEALATIALPAAHRKLADRLFEAREELPVI